MINGLGVLGWGVGGIEAEAVMLGQVRKELKSKLIERKICFRAFPFCYRKSSDTN